MKLCSIASGSSGNCIFAGSERVPGHVVNDLRVKLTDFLFDDRRKGILDPPMEHFIARGDNAYFFMYEGLQFQDRPSLGCPEGRLLCSCHLLFLNHQRDNPGACQLVPLLYREVAVAGGNHHLPRYGRKVYIGNR